MSAVLKELITTIAEQHGFRERDYSLTWDGGQFDPRRSIHELLINIADGRQASTQIIYRVLSKHDPWKYMRDVDAAFETLNRRAWMRGI
jgi:hypothetical protein